jgi:hypothetical protein
MSNQPALTAPDNQKTHQARKLIDEVLEPRIRRIIEQANGYLAKKLGIQVGIEITWYFVGIDGDQSERQPVHGPKPES